MREGKEPQNGTNKLIQKKYTLKIKQNTLQLKTMGCNQTRIVYQELYIFRSLTTHTTSKRLNKCKIFTQLHLPDINGTAMENNNSRTQANTEPQKNNKQNNDLQSNSKKTIRYLKTKRLRRDPRIILSNSLVTLAIPW